MAHYLARIRFPYTTGLPADVAINDLSFECDLGDLVALGPIIGDFYIVTPGGATGSISSFMSSVISRATDSARVDFYDRAGVSGAPPVAFTTFTPDAPQSAVNLVEECACCASFHADLSVAGTYARRRRGRIFIGPLCTGSLTQESSGVLHISDELVYCLNHAMDNLKTECDALGVTWEVWSSVNNSGAAVVGGWVDNAPDTLRSRGEKPTSRVTWP